MKQFVDQTGILILGPNKYELYFLKLNTILFLGGTVTDEITQCSVLVTDKIRCTMKILSAIARGCPIVNVNWLKHSYTVKMFQGFFSCMFIIVNCV